MGNRARAQRTARVRKAASRGLVHGHTSWGKGGKRNRCQATLPSRFGSTKKEISHRVRQPGSEQELELGLRLQCMRIVEIKHPAPLGSIQNLETCTRKVVPNRATAPLQG